MPPALEHPVDDAIGLGHGAAGVQEQLAHPSAEDTVPASARHKRGVRCAEAAKSGFRVMSHMGCGMGGTAKEEKSDDVSISLGGDGVRQTPLVLLGILTLSKTYARLYPRR